jgi:tRNA dimethylallyltransferase
MIIVISGPTATGKTDLGILLAQELDGEVVSADSMMIYKYMDIGTAKPTKEEMKGIPHHLIDLVLPSENFSVKDYINHFDKTVKNILQKGKVPIVVGGSWLYIQGSLYGLSDAPEGDWKIREKLYSVDNNLLYEKLKNVDPLYAKKIHPKDKRRIVRALEVYEISGKPFSYFQHGFNNPRYKFLSFNLERERNELMERIKIRVEKMFEKGLVEEVKKLVDMGFRESITAMQAIGYKEILPYLDKKISLEEAKSSIIENTKDFAKRQIRTFRNKTRFENLNLSNINIKEALEIIKSKIKEVADGISSR